MKIFLFTISICFIPVYLLAMSADDVDYVTEEYPPYNYTENGTVSGFAVETLKLVWKEMGVPQQKILVKPWARGMMQLELKGSTMLFAGAWNGERARKFKFVKPLARLEAVIIAPCSKLIPVISIKELKKYYIGVVRGGVNESILLESGFPEERLIRFRSINTGIQMFLKGRFDLLAGEKASLFHFLSEAGAERDNFDIVYVFSISENGYMFSQDVPDSLVRRFQQALDAVRSSSEFDSLKKRFLPDRMP